MRTFVDMKQVVALLESGEWELGYFDGIRDDGTYQLQRGGLSKGGETIGVRATTIKALERRNLVKRVPREPNQPFWLHRYRFTGKVVGVAPDAKNVPTGPESGK